MKISIDTKEDKEEIRKVIRLLQQIIGEDARTNFDLSSTLGSSSSAPAEPVNEDVSAGLFSLFGNDAPSSLQPKDEDDDDDSDPIEIIDF